MIWRKNVSEGLKTIGYDTEGSKSLLNSLHEAHQLAQHGDMINAVNQSRSPSTNNEPAAEESTESLPTTENKTPKKAQAITKTSTKPSKPLTAEEEKTIETLQNIAFGTWFEFRKDHKKQQLKLAWFSKVSSHYMFVDHAGVKQAIENQLDLAKAMIAGTAAIVNAEKKPFMERALEAVFDTLKFKS